MTPFRLFLLGFALLASAASQAQSLTVCQGGSADSYPCNRIDLGANVSLETMDANRGNDIWGWTDPQTDREYALVGLSNGTAFVDVTEPTEPVYLGKLPTATEPSGWRDIKVRENYAFVVSEAPGHGMQVFDLTRLRDVPSPPATFEADARYTGAGKAHNLVIDPEAGFAYLVGANENGFDCNAGGLHMVDIRDPLTPAFAGCHDTDGYVHDAQCLTYDGPDTDYLGHEICMTSSVDHVGFVDVTDKANPVLIASGFYVNPAYTHQNWLTDDGRYLLVNDELDESGGLTSNTRTMVFNVEDLDNPEFVQFFFGHSAAIDHNLYVRGRYAFQSNYRTGLRVVDLAGIDDGVLTEVAAFDTYPEDDGTAFNGQWSNYPFFPSGTIIASDIERGLFVLVPQFSIVTDADTSGPEVPGDARYALSPASPNPASGRTTLRLVVTDNQQVEAEVFDVAGRRVAALFSGTARVGIPLALTVEGGSLPAGLYLVRVTGEHFTATRRISLIR